MSIPGNLLKNYSRRSLYLTAGLLFGLCFPLIGQFLDIAVVNGLPFEWDSIQYVHSENPLNYLLDLAPVVIASISYLLGVSADRVAFYSAHLEDLVHERTVALSAAKDEQDAILGAVDEGLFLLEANDGKYRISSEHSAALKRILSVEDLSQADMIAVLERMIPAARVSETRDFLDLIFRPGDQSSIVRNLNPLDEISLSTPVRNRKATISDRSSENPSDQLTDHIAGRGSDRAGNPVRGLDNAEIKHVRFRFAPLISGERTRYLVSVRDNTREVVLAADLQAKEESNRKQTDMLLSMLHVGPSMVEDFMDGVDAELAAITSAMKAEGGRMEPADSLEQIFRSVHSIKGNASLLDLKFLEQEAHGFEEKIQEVRSKPSSLEWSDFIPLAFDLAKLQHLYGELKEMLDRVAAFQTTVRGPATSVSLLPGSIEKLVKRLVDETDKKIRCDFSAFNAEEIPTGYAYILRDVLVQMARNSVVHGIETPSIRVQAGKTEQGTINVSAKRADGRIEIRFRDDGGGFPFEAIRRKAVESGRAGEADVESWAPSRLVRLVFEPGFSTAPETTLNAGRGMGMDIIMQRVKSVRGEIRVSHGAGEFVEFILLLPADTGGLV